MDKFGNVGHRSLSAISMRWHVWGFRWNLWGPRWTYSQKLQRWNYLLLYNHFECENKFMRDIPVSIPWVLLWEHIPAHTRHGWCDWLQTWLSLYCGCFLQTHSSNNSDNLQSSKLSLHVQLNFNQPRIDREKFWTTEQRRTINHPLNSECSLYRVIIELSQIFIFLLFHFYVVSARDLSKLK